MLINLSTQDFGSLSENVPRVKLSNMYTVQNPLSPQEYSYIPRPIVVPFINFGADKKLRGVWYQAQGGQIFVYIVADTSFYKMDIGGTYEYIGEIPGSDFCTFASTIYGIGICSSGALYLYQGGDELISVIIPDGNQATDITSLDNYFIVGIKNSNKFYWIAPGETAIDGLSFISAERNPDDIISVTTVGDELWILGQSTVEVFSSTGQADAPFLRIIGRAYQTGCASKTSVVKTLKDTLPCLIWVTPSKEVILAQGSPSIKISNESIEELLKSSTYYIAWPFRANKHDFVVISTNIATLVYDLTTNNWYRWATYNQETWKAVAGIQVNDTVYTVDSDSGVLSTLSNIPVENSTDFLVCEVAGYVPVLSRTPLSCNDVTLFLNYGYSTSYTQEPVVELRWSDDGGANWSAYIQGSLGSKGAYSAEIIFRSLGLVKQPGRRFEIRFSEIQSFRLDGATING